MPSERPRRGNEHHNLHSGRERRTRRGDQADSAVVIVGIPAIAGFLKTGCSRDPNCRRDAATEMRMADDYDDGSAEIFTAVVSIIILIAITVYLIYAGVIHDWITGGAAVGILIVYVAVCLLLAPWVISSGPTKGQS